MPDFWKKAEGGRRAEVGSASAMAAAAITMAAGGTPFQASQAICFVLKKYVGTHLRPCSRIG